MPINAGQAVAYLELNADKFKTGLSSAGKDLAIFKDDTATAGDKIGAVGSTMAHVGGTMTKAFTVPLVAAGGLMVSTAINFEDGMAKVGTIADTTVASIDELGGGVQDLAKRVGMDTADLSEALYQTISATNDTENAMGYLNQAAELAKGGFTDVTTAVDGATSVMNAYGETGQDAFQKVADIMITTQNLGKTTVDELARSLYNVIPSAAAAGISFEEVGAAIATITAQGTPTTVATTQLRQAIVAFQKPNADMIAGLGGVVEKLIAQGKITGQNADNFVELSKRVKDTTTKMAALEKAGKTNTKEYKELKAQADDYQEQLAGVSEQMGTQVLESEGLQGALVMLNDEVGGSSTDMAKMLGSVEALNASLQLTSETGSAKFQTSMEGMQTASGATEEAFQKMDETTKSSFDKMKASVQVLGQSFGELMLPIIQQVVEWVQSLVDWLNSLDEGTKETILTVVAIVAAIGPLLLILGKVAGAIGTISNMLGAASGPVGWAILAVGAIIALATAFDTALSALFGFGDEFDEVNKKMVENAENVTPWADAYAAAAGKINDVNTVMDEHGNNLETLQTTIDTAEEAITEILRIAYEEQGELRAEDIANIEAYLQQIVDAEAQKIHIYELNQQIELDMIQREMATKDHLTEQEFADYLKRINTGYAEANAAVDAGTQAQLQILYNMYQSDAERQSAEFQNKYNAIMEQDAKMKAEIQGYCNESFAIVNSHYTDIDGVQLQYYNDLNAHNDRVNDAWDNQFARQSDWFAAERALEENNNAENRKIRDDAYAAYKDSIDATNQALEEQHAFQNETWDKINIDTANAYLSMLLTEMQAGYELSEQEKANVKAILDAYEYLPGDMEDNGKAIYEGLVAGFDKIDPTIPVNETAQDLIWALMDRFGISSPAKVTTTIGEQFGQGLANGIKNKQGTVWDYAVSLARKALQAVKDILGISSPSKYGIQYGENLGQSVGTGLIRALGFVKKRSEEFGDGLLNTLFDNPDYGFDTYAGNVSGRKAGVNTTNNNSTVNNITIQSSRPLNPLETANEVESILEQIAEGVA